MIYLIGAPPRCGKTTLAKKLSKKIGAPWISCDTLCAITRIYTPKKEWHKKYPYYFLRKENKTKSNDDFYNTYSATEIIKALKKQSQTTYDAIDTIIACEIADKNDYIIEGYHITPTFSEKMIKKYGKQNIKTIFLTKFDENKFALDVHKSTTPNDWLIRSTKEKQTFIKVGKMISLYSKYFKKEAEKFNFKFLNMDMNFNEQIDNAIKYLIK